MPVLSVLRMLIDGDTLCVLEGGSGVRNSDASWNPSLDGFLLIRPDLVVVEPASDVFCEDAVISWGCALPIRPVHS